MKKLRVIVTYKCERSCVGCCNKQSDFTPDKVTAVNLADLRHDSGSEYSISNFDELILTGGEPLLAMPTLIKVKEYVFDHRQDLWRKNMQVNGNFRVVLYTAWFERLFLPEVWNILRYLVDGVTITLHNFSDYNRFFGLGFDYKFIELGLLGKNMRINAIELDDRVELSTKKLFEFKLERLKEYGAIKYPMKWIDNCPLPENETLIYIKPQKNV